MEEEYLDMKMRGDASVIALLACTRTMGTERRLWCLIGIQLFVRMEGARQVGEAHGLFLARRAMSAQRFARPLKELAG
jgi:hypothetical protein